MYSGITSGRVLDGERLYTKILEVNLFAFAYRLFHRDFSPIKGTYCIWDAICSIDWREIDEIYKSMKLKILDLYHHLTQGMLVLEF